MRVRKPSLKAVAANESMEYDSLGGEEAAKSSKRKRLPKEKKVGTSTCNLSDEDYIVCGFPNERVPAGFRHNPAFDFVGMAEDAFMQHLTRFLLEK
jgi:hypothetical protein